MDAGKIERTVAMGGGFMGAGFAQIMAQAGCHVYVVDLTDAQLEKCLRQVKDGLSIFVENGLLAQEEVAPILGRIELTTSLEKAAADAQFVIEAVAERLDVKQEVFEQLDRLTPPDAILATNTSGIRVSDIAERTKRPERVVGSHFFYPHTLIPLAEVMYGNRTSDETVETTVAFWKRCGKEPVVCRKDMNGFVVNRLQAALGREVMSVVQSGAMTPSDIDRALRLALGIRMPLWGLLEQRDWSGLDIHAAMARSVYPTLENADAPLPALVDRVERGDVGVKSGKGFFDWTGKDIEAMRRKRQQQLIEMIKAVKRVMPEEEKLVDNL